MKRLGSCQRAKEAGEHESEGIVGMLGTVTKGLQKRLEEFLKNQRKN